MIVSHSQKFIFVHLHKTGGTSVTNTLLPYLAEGDVVICGSKGLASKPGVDNSISSLRKHSSAKRIRQELGLALWESYFTFSFVRHPFDRLVSLFEFLNRVKRNQVSKKAGIRRFLTGSSTTSHSCDPTKVPWNWPSMQALLSTNTFSEFIRSDLLAKDQAAKPQAELLSDTGEKLIVDFVGKFETLNVDWQKICRLLRIESKLKHMNRSDRRFGSLGKYLTESDRQYMVDKYRNDFELFEYSQHC